MGPLPYQKNKHVAKTSWVQGKSSQVGEHNQSMTGSQALIHVSTKAPIEDGFTLVTNRRAKGNAILETHQHNKLEFHPPP